MNQEKRSSVAERLQYARQHYSPFDLVTEIVKVDADYCVVQAVIRIEGRIVSTGHAIEYKRSHIAYVEVAETCAIGRALAIAGFTDDTEIASQEELTKAFRADIEEGATPLPVQKSMTLDEALQTRTKSGKRYADLEDANLKYILDNATNEKSKEAAQIVLNHRNKL